MTMDLKQPRGQERLSTLDGFTQPAMSLAVICVLMLSSWQYAINRHTSSEQQQSFMRNVLASAVDGRAPTDAEREVAARIGVTREDFGVLIENKVGRIVCQKLPEDSLRVTVFFMENIAGMDTSWDGWRIMPGVLRAERPDLADDCPEATSIGMMARISLWLGSR